MNDESIKKMMDRFFVDYKNHFLVTGMSRGVPDARHENWYRMLMLKSYEPEKYPDYAMLVIENEFGDIDAKIFEYKGSVSL